MDSGRTMALCRRGALLAVGCLVLVPVGCGDDRPGDDALAERSSVRIEAFGCSRVGQIGMGAMVEPGLVASVAHVVAGSDEIVLTTADGRVGTGTVVAIDREIDLALLATDLELPALPLGSPEIGRSGAYLVWREGTGLLSDAAIERRVALTAPTIDHDATAERSGVQIGATVVHGDSGSVLVSGGRAVGIVFARSTQSETRGWATAISELSTLLDGVVGEPDAESELAAVDVGPCT